MSIGRQLERAELFAEDADGNRIRTVARECIGYTIMPVKETPPHALSRPASVSGEDEQREQEERAARAQWEALDDLTKEVARLSMLRLGVFEQKIPFPASQRADKEKLGWFFVKELSVRRGVSMVLMVRNNVKTLSPEDIGERVGLTRHQVSRLLNRIPGSLYRLAELRGWL